VETRSQYSPEPFPSFRYTFTSFSGGSDHYIYSDPTVGVPMPAMIQFPDRFYHSTADTPDQVDPHMLRTSGTIAAAFAYWTANAGLEDVTWLIYEMQAHFHTELVCKLQREYNALFSSHRTGSREEAYRWIKKHADHALGHHFQSLASLAKLDPASTRAAREMKKKSTRLAEELLDHYRSAIELLEVIDNAPAKEGSWEEKAGTLVPARLYRGPARFDRLTSSLPAEERDEWMQLNKTHEWAYDLISLAEYWADGKRTCLEITDCIELECGLRDAELVVKTFALLEKFGLAKIHHV